VTGPRVGIVAVVLAVSGCTFSGPTGPRSTPLEPRWQDAVDSTPDLLVAIRPVALRRDPSFGPLLQRIVDLGRQRSRVVADTRALEAMEDSEEVILALRLRDQGGSGDESDELVIIRGVRADIDPARLVDSEGQPLWSAGPSGPVRELERAHAIDEGGASRPPSSSPDDEGGASRPPSSSPEAAVDVSLFELPARTWVIATGPSRIRARRAFAHPVGRSDPPFSPDALVTVRVDGPTLVSRLPALRRATQLGAIGRGLVTVEITLPPSRDRLVRAELLYGNVAKASEAESAVRAVVGALTRSVQGAKAQPTGWIYALVSARVERKGDRSVSIECPWSFTPEDDALRQVLHEDGGVSWKEPPDAGNIPLGPPPSL